MGKSRGDFLSLFFPRHFLTGALRLLALYYPGFYWGTQREVGWHEGPLFCLFVFFVFSFLLLVIVTFLRFVVSSSPIRITLECKQIVPFSPHPSSLSALPFFHPGNFSRDTSCDSVWPMKSSLHASYEAKGSEAEALQGRESVQFLEKLSNFLLFSSVLHSWADSILSPSVSLSLTVTIWKQRWPPRGCIVARFLKFR